MQSIHEDRKYSCPTCDKEFTRKEKLQKHFKVCNVEHLEKEEVLQRLQQQNDKYLKTLREGEIYATLLKENPGIREECLTVDQKLKLKTFQESHTYSMNDIVLRPWQQELITQFESPTNREIIWVSGCVGDEGKTFFQKYVLSSFGTRRVCMLDLMNDSKSIYHTLSKCCLTCKDIFLFNIPRNGSVNECSYDVLEAIKDGQCLTSKYNSKILKFTTPNIVMVFSNSWPREDVLSVDRWKMFGIQTNQLIPIHGVAGFLQSVSALKSQSRKSYKKQRKLTNYRSDDTDC